MPHHEATFIYTKAVTGSSCCLQLCSEDVSEELSEEENRIVQQAQCAVLELLEDVLRKDWVLIQNLKVVVVLAREGREGKGWVQRYAMLTKMLLQRLLSQLYQVASQKNPCKARSYAYKKIKVILEEQE